MLPSGSQNVMPECSFHEAVLRLRYWQKGGDSFSCKLYTLMQKADPGNYVRLAQGFPVHAMAHKAWQSSPDEEIFFRDYLTEEPHP